MTVTFFQQRNPLMINVKDLDIIGDNATDVSGPLQSILNMAAASGTGMEVFVPPGLYRIGTKITLPSGTVLRGVSSGSYPDNNSLNQVTVLIRMANMNDHVLYAPDGNNQIRIFDLAVDGNKNNNTSGSGLYIQDGASGQESQLILERCYFHDNPGSNVYLGKNRRANKLVHSIFNYSNVDGITVAGSDNSIEGCIIGSNTRGGIVLGTTITQNWAASASPNAAAVCHVINNDVYGNQVGIALASGASDCIIEGNGVDRHSLQGITLYDGSSNAIASNSFHSNGTQTNNTYGHIDVASGVTAVVVNGNNFGPQDSGVTNVASYAITVASTSNRVIGNIGVVDSTATVGGITNSVSGGSPFVTLSNAGAVIQGSGNDIFQIKTPGGSLVFKITNGGTPVYSGGGAQFNVSSNHVFGSSTPIGSGANLLSLKTTNTAIAQLATQNVASQTANILTCYASDGTTVLLQIDKSGNLLAASLATSQSASAAAIGNNSTITTSIGIARVNPAANVTGIIMQAGTQMGQRCVVRNESAFTVTFDVAGTSHVADGATSPISANCSREFEWSGSLWYRMA